MFGNKLGIRNEKLEIKVSPAVINLKKGEIHMINWKVRIRSVQFWVGLIGVILAPILTYLGIGYEDITSWEALGSIFVNFFGNPYLIGVVVMAVLGAIGVITDPTTKGVSDSLRAMSYDKPKGEE